MESVGGATYALTGKYTQANTKHAARIHIQAHTQSSHVHKHIHTPTHMHTDTYGIFSFNFPLRNRLTELASARDLVRKHLHMVLRNEWD